MDMTPDTIRKRATDARVTLAQVLKLAGVSLSCFYHWEHGRTTPKPVTLGRISDALLHFERLKREKGI